MLRYSLKGKKIHKKLSKDTEKYPKDTLKFHNWNPKDTQLAPKRYTTGTQKIPQRNPKDTLLQKKCGSKVLKMLTKDTKKVIQRYPKRYQTKPKDIKKQ